MSMSGIVVRPLAGPQLVYPSPALPPRPGPGQPPPLKSYGTSRGPIHLALGQMLPPIFR